MARERLDARALSRELGKELRPILEDVCAYEGQLAYPEDWYALVLLAAERIAPAMLRTAGLPQEEERLTSVSRLLVTAWGNALLVDGGAIEEFHRQRMALLEEAGS